MPKTVSALLAAPFAAFCLSAAAFGATAAQAGEEAPAATEVPEDVMKAGGELYMANCRFCHGSKGTAGKRLAGNENVADADYVAGTILVGPGYMTAFEEHLSDEEIALIATFVRNSWGNAYGLVQSEDVAPLR